MSQISSKQMSTEEIKAALNDTFQTLKALQDSEAVGVEAEPEETNPVIDPKINSKEQNHLFGMRGGVQDALPQTSQIAQPTPRIPEKTWFFRSVAALRQSAV